MHIIGLFTRLYVFTSFCLALNALALPFVDHDNQPTFARIGQETATAVASWQKIASPNSDKPDYYQSIKLAESYITDKVLNPLEQALIRDYLGWLYYQTQHADKAIANYKLALELSSLSFNNLKLQKLSAQHLIEASVAANQANEVFDYLYATYFTKLPQPYLNLQYGETYANLNQLELALKLFTLVEQSPLNAGDYNRYLYYGYLIRALALHQRQDLLPQYTKAYIQEGKSVPWDKLIAWAQQQREVKPISAVPPEYPSKALRRMKSGYTLVSFTITTEGKVKEAKILETYPAGLFDATSLKAVYKFKFAPLVGPTGEPLEKQGQTTTFSFEVQTI